MVPRTGRPPSDNPRTNAVPIRLADDEYALLKEAAEIAEVRPGEYIRDTALEAARKTVRKAAAKRSR